jgi:hypothetical protein
MTDEPKPKPTFATLDLYLAAFLTRKGIDSHPEVSDRGKVVFVFDKDAAFNHMDEFHNPETIVHLQEFIREVKFLRGVMNNMRTKKG